MPVIARINGHAIGGGCELIQACDIRIAHKDALNRPAGNKSRHHARRRQHQHLPHLIVEGQAMRLILTGELLDADEAADNRLVDEVHDDDTFDERVYELVEQMAEKSPVALEFAKKAVRASSRIDFQEAIEYAAELFYQLLHILDKMEGITAFSRNVIRVARQVSRGDSERQDHDPSVG